MFGGIKLLLRGHAHRPRLFIRPFVCTRTMGLCCFQIKFEQYRNAIVKLIAVPSR